MSLSHPTRARLQARASQLLVSVLLSPEEAWGRRGQGIARAVNISASTLPFWIVLWFLEACPPHTFEDLPTLALAFGWALTTSTGIAVGLLSDGTPVV